LTIAYNLIRSFTSSSVLCQTILVTFNSVISSNIMFFSFDHCHPNLCNVPYFDHIHLSIPP
jgi:hypothetical protein